MSTAKTRGWSLGNFGFLVWKHSSISTFKSCCAFCCIDSYSNIIFFFTISYKGAATVMKLDIWFLHWTAVSKKALNIFPIVSLVGYLPLYKHSNSTIVILSLQIVVLGPKKVPPAYFILCKILLTVSRCSNMNFCIPGFCSRVSTLPLSCYTNF